MAIIVQKFGGTSLSDPARIENVARIVTSSYREGNDMVVVVSAQGDTTDELIKLGEELNPKPSRREMDTLISSGEQISAALLSIAIENLCAPAVSLLGWQVGLETSSAHREAKISRVHTERIRKELDQRHIVVAAGFQGVDRHGDITTIGRGGSDTSAVAIAAALHADLCQIFTDVDGIYTADPRKVRGARKLESISYDEMLELATLGAQVLHNRSVELAKKYNIELEVLSSLHPGRGTIVKERRDMETMLISGVTIDKDAARISILGVPDRPGLAFKIFSCLAAKGINVDVILQSIGRNGTKDISFTVTTDKMEESIKILNEHLELWGASGIIYDENIAKVSIVGAGMETNPGVAAQMFEALYSSNINIQMISTSEIKITVLVNKPDGDRAVCAIHEKFFGA